MPESADYWHGVRAEDHPEVEFPGCEPCGGPGKLTQGVVVLLSDLSVHARKRTRSMSSYSHPVSVSACLYGGAGTGRGT